MLAVATVRRAMLTSYTKRAHLGISRYEYYFGRDALAFSIRSTAVPCSADSLAVAAACGKRAQLRKSASVFPISSLLSGGGPVGKGIKPGEGTEQSFLCKHSPAANPPTGGRGTGHRARLLWAEIRWFPSASARTNKRVLSCGTQRIKAAGPGCCSRTWSDSSRLPLI